MANDTVLESGTNELELLEFKIGGNCYGINVAKIKEILPYQMITPVPNSHEYIEGIFMPRDMLITLVDLASALHQPPSRNINSDMFIVTRFNTLTIAFHVHSVEGIHRVSWQDINKPDDTINDINSVSTGIIKIDGRLIIILDFEKIIGEISPETSLRVSEMDDFDERERSDVHIVMAEDSMLLAKQMKDCLAKAGYVNLSQVNNGFEAWNLLEKYKSLGRAEEIKCVITDIEMPVMDGHHLTKLIKSDSVYGNTPVIIFSSLVSDEMVKRGTELGADAQLSKPEIGRLVKTIDDVLAKK